jgi:hypothetical protein
VADETTSNIYLLNSTCQALNGLFPQDCTIDNAGENPYGMASWYLMEFVMSRQLGVKLNRRMSADG